MSEAVEGLGKEGPCELPAEQLERARTGSPFVYRMVKRVLDLAIAVPVCVLCLPFLGAVAIAIRLDSSGPVLFKQRRRGLGFEPFTIMKFRSLRHGARDPHARYEMLEDDPRITRVGGWLRRTSLDEAPQIFNVIGGSMSLVGPRPLVEWESRQALERFAERFQVKPGLTGWSQVTVRNSVGFDERCEKDLEYVRRKSIRLDLCILALTPASLLRGDGIYPGVARAMKLSIIILNHNSGRMLVECLDSVFADTAALDVEVIVPDNESSDDSLELAERKWGGRITILHNGANRGFSWGNNKGVAIARGEFVCLLNPDTIVHTGAFATLLAFMDGHPKAGCIGPKVLNQDGSFQLSAKRSIPSPFDAMSRALFLSRLFPRSRRFARYNVTYLDPDVTQQVDASTGCCMLFRRRALDEVGLLDDGYFIYCEDVDWFLRAKNAGWEVWYVAEAVIEHHHAYSTRFRKSASVRNFHDSMIRFYRKHYAARYPAPFNLFIHAAVRARMHAMIAYKTLRGWEMSAPETALVTGGAGFLGSHVAERLVGMGLRVVVLDDLSGGYRRNVPPGAELCEGSIVDAARVEDLFRRHEFTYVFHLAAHAAEVLSHFIRRHCYTVNVLGTANLVNAAVRYGTRCFVFTSSIAVYGTAPERFDESTPPRPAEPYGIAKLSVELDLAAAGELFGLRHVVFRPHNVYGERQNLSDPYRNVIAIFMRQVLKGEPCTIFGDGEQRRAFTYIGDVAPVIAESVRVPGAMDGVFNLGSDTSCSLNELAELVQSALGRRTGIVHLPARPEGKDVTSSHERMRDVFGTRPAVTLEEGLERMAAWARTLEIAPARPFEALEIERGAAAVLGETRAETDVSRGGGVTPNLSIVVLNHNSGGLLTECLNSVFADEIPFAFEVIVPDNASTDGSLDRAALKWKERIRPIRTGANRGSASGNNIGIRAARGRYIALLNPDTVIHRGCFRTLVDFLDAHPKAACAGPRVYNTDGSPQLSAKRRMPDPWDAVTRALLLSKLFRRSRVFARYDPDYGDPARTQTVDACASCCMVLRREALDQVGLFDEGYFLYCDDVDWFLRAKSLGWEIAYVAEASIVHHHAYSVRFRRSRAVRDFHASMIRFYRKHHASRHPRAFNGAMVAAVHGRMYLVILKKTLLGWGP